jgi:hypothetical protein
LKKRLIKEPTPENLVRFQVDPQSRLNFEVIRDTIGPELAIIVMESGKVGIDWVRDAVDPETEAQCRFARQLIPPGKRDTIEDFCRPP